MHSLLTPDYVSFTCLDSFAMLTPLRGSLIDIHISSVSVTGGVHVFGRNFYYILDIMLLPLITIVFRCRYVLETLPSCVLVTFTLSLTVLVSPLCAVTDTSVRISN